MSHWTSLFYFSAFIAAMLLSVLGLWFAAVIPGLDRWSKRFFLSFFSVFILCCIFCLLEVLVLSSHRPIAAVYLVLFLESLFLMLPLPMLTFYLLHCCGEDLRSSKLMRAVLGLVAAYLIMLVSALFTNAFSVITKDGQYIRGPLYPLLLLPLLLILLLTLAGATERRNQISRKVFLSFLVAIVPMTLAVFIQVFFEVYPLLDISYILAALSMYSFILSDQIEKDRRRQQEIADQQREIADQQREIANQRASILVLQMRPHFIYNTLTSIYSLCGQDPQKARQVILDFTAYLRKNFTAVASEVLIPFSAELEHTRAYLAVEQALHEDSLSVEYDMPHIMFRLPPLTLQPIVENAVKHGRDPFAGPFHISIRTRKTDSGSEITVADDGRGFEPAGDSEPHIALNNIRQRLALMCDGHLTIAPNEGRGTVVTVTIPDRPEQ